MTTTPNLHLPQWEASDRIMMDDFNDAMESIDAGVKANADAIAAGLHMLTGTYTGNGQSSRTINVGIAPKAVIIWDAGFLQFNGGTKSGGVAFAGKRSSVIQVTETGFTVYCISPDMTNMRDTEYFYIIFY